MARHRDMAGSAWHGMGSSKVRPRTQGGRRWSQVAGGRLGRHHGGPEKIGSADPEVAECGRHGFGGSGCSPEMKEEKARRRSLGGETAARVDFKEGGRWIRHRGVARHRERGGGVGLGLKDEGAGAGTPGGAKAADGSSAAAGGGARRTVGRGGRRGARRKRWRGRRWAEVAVKTGTGSGDGTAPAAMLGRAPDRIGRGGVERQPVERRRAGGGRNGRWQ